MRFRGVIFAGAVVSGMVLSDTVLPVPVPVARAAALAAVAATAGCRPLWPLVGIGIGLLRAADERRAFDRLSLARPGRFGGPIEILAEAGKGVVVRAGSRHVLVTEPPPGFPGPGSGARTLLRLDPVRSRAEPSAFRAEAWAAGKGLHARGRVLGDFVATGPSPGPVARARRVGLALREHARRRLGVRTGEGADLTAALLLGDRYLLEDDLLRGFRHAGLSHVLALSGAHLVVLAAGLAALLRALRAPRAALGVATILFIVVYTALTGAGPPLVRACVTMGLATLGDLLGRRSATLGALGWALGVLLLVHPAWRDDVGFRLSFAATAVLAAFAGAPRGPDPGGLRGRLRGLHLALLASTLVTLGTLPELASSFGLVSLLAPLTNLLAGPPSAAALAWGGLAAFGPFPAGGAAALAMAARRASDTMIFGIARIAHWPGGDFRVPALPLAASAGLVYLAFRGSRGSRPGRRDAMVLGVAVAGTALGLLPRERMTVLDVGQGDSVLLEAGGSAVLVDAGPPGTDGYDSAAGPAIRRRRVRPLDALVITHGHMDHLGGAADVARERGFRRLVVRPDDGHVPPPLQELLQATAARGIPVVRARGGEALLHGRLRVTAPFVDRPPEDADENDRSLAAAWEAPAFRADLFGDGARAPQDALRERHALAPAAVALLPHHGSRENTDDALLRDTAVRLALISCGTGNVYGHPHAETLARVRASGAALLRTDVDGTITISATRRGFRLHWVRDWPGPRSLFPRFARSAAVG